MAGEFDQSDWPSQTDRQTGGTSGTKLELARLRGISGGD